MQTCGVTYRYRNTAACRVHGPASATQMARSAVKLALQWLADPRWWLRAASAVTLIRPVVLLELPLVHTSNHH
jgi:hypothetical protein